MYLATIFSIKKEEIKMRLFAKIAVALFLTCAFLGSVSDEKPIGQDGAVARPKGAGKPVGKDGSVVRPKPTNVKLSGEVHSTSISGFAGSASTIGDAESNKYALYGLLSRECLDKPCYIMGFFENIMDSDMESRRNKDLCGPNGPTSSNLYVAYEDGIHGDRVFVTGIKVCMNNAETRVKGLRIRGKKIANSGNLVDLTECEEKTHAGGSDYEMHIVTEPSDSRVNCRHWKSWAECPNGYLATAAIVHYGAEQEPKSLTGIALKCKKLTKD